MSEDDTVALDAASEGMVLTRDLCDQSGAVLMLGGATLSAAALNSLRRRGIERVPVQLAGTPEADPAALLAEQERQCARLAHLFRRCADDGASAQLLARLIAYRKGD